MSTARSLRLALFSMQLNCNEYRVLVSPTWDESQWFQNRISCPLRFLILWAPSIAATCCWHFIANMLQLINYPPQYVVDRGICAKSTASIGNHRDKIIPTSQEKRRRLRRVAGE